MGLSFLAPLFFAGAALIAAPYLIHQIRRPEREPLRFSSVLFIPNIPKEVIERRRVQHWLLMLLRMTVLALLALAFARPYWRALAAGDSEDAPVRHMILLDRSYSMGAGDAFEAAKRAARRIINEAGAGEPVGVILFGQRPEEVAPLRSDTDPKAGSRDAARTAVELASLTYESTRYVPALQLAQERLLADSEDASKSNQRYVIHLITDVQRTGLPAGHSGWKLSPTVELDLIPVGQAPPANYAISDVYVRLAQTSGLRVLGKLRNWTDQDARGLRVRLVVNDEEIDSKPMDVKARSATQVSFQLPDLTEPVASGYLEVSPGGVAADDRRYFAWSPPRQSRVDIVATADVNERWPARWFFERALPPDPKTPWRSATVPPAELPGVLSNVAERPEALIVAEPGALDATALAAVREYVEQGGQVLMTLDGRTDAQAVNPLLLDPMGLHAETPKVAAPNTSQSRMMAWVNLEHPIFVPFQGTRFNDFSAVRFFNVVPLTVDEPAQVLARLEDDAPAMAEASAGEGRLIVWSFPVELEWTNLPKTQRFVPLLYETLAYLTDIREERRSWSVGDAIGPRDFELDDQGRGEILTPGAASPASVTRDENAIALSEPGVLRLRAAGDTTWTAVQAVNVDADEGNPERLTTEQFQIKVATAPIVKENNAETGIVGADVDRSGYIIDREYGRLALLSVLALILVECWYMSWLGSRVNPKPRGG